MAKPARPGRGSGVDKNGRSKRDGQYANFSYFMMRSRAFRSLSGPALKILMELRTRFNGGNNGKLVLSMEEAKSLLGMGKTTAARAFKELQDKGFIELTTPGAWYHRRAHEWRLTFVALGPGCAPTNEWQNWRPPKKTERGPETEPSASSVVPFQDRKRSNRSVSGPVKPNRSARLGPETEHY